MRLALMDEMTKNKVVHPGPLVWWFLQFGLPAGTHVPLSCLGRFPGFKLTRLYLKSM
jgi:hypothetical protein